jgi:hypothetical protein
MNSFMSSLSPAQMSTFLQHLLDKDEQDDSRPPFIYEPGETPADILGSVQDAVVDLVRYALERDRQIEALQAELRRRDREIFAGRQAMRDAEGATKH